MLKPAAINILHYNIHFWFLLHIAAGFSQQNSFLFFHSLNPLASANGFNEKKKTEIYFAIESIIAVGFNRRT